MLKKTADDWFAENMREWREARGISQAELAQRLTGLGHAGIHQTTIARMERGNRVVRLSEAESIAKILGATIGMLTMPRVQVLQEVERELAQLVDLHKQLRGDTVNFEIARTRVDLAVEDVQHFLDGSDGLDEDSRAEVLRAFSEEYLSERLAEAARWTLQSAEEVVSAEMPYAHSQAEEDRAARQSKGLGPISFARFIPDGVDDAE